MEIELAKCDHKINDLSNLEKTLYRQGDILCLLGWRLAQAGAESRLVINSLTRVAKVFLLDNVEFFLTRSNMSVIITYGEQQFLFSRKIENFGINMSQVSELYNIFLRIITGKLIDLKSIRDEILNVKAPTYNKILLVLVEAFAASAFAYLNGGNFYVCLSALCGGLVLMAVRFRLLSLGFYETFTFMASAFLGCSISFVLSHVVLSASLQDIKLSVMATTLLLVPGYPIMNGFLDLFKGYVETGIFRLIQAFILTMAAATGLLGALYMLGYFVNV